MAGEKSGLSQATIDEMAHWDHMFDFEVHGGRLSLAAAASATFVVWSTPSP
jgi:hypothetical protein